MTKYTDAQSHFPFSKFESTSKKGLEQCKQLAEILPHGSGINGDWHIKKNGKRFICSNTYSAMNEHGSYCHDYNFTAWYELNNDKFEYVKMVMQAEIECCGYGLNDYLDDTLAMN